MSLLIKLENHILRKKEALGSSELLRKVRSRRDLLDFKDGMLIMSNEHEEIKRTVDELACFYMNFNLRFDIKKSDIF